jgi:hypothetical protein
VAQDLKSDSKGYGFVHFETEEAANLAVEKVNGMMLAEKQVCVWGGGGVGSRAAQALEQPVDGRRGAGSERLQRSSSSGAAAAEQLQLGEAQGSEGWRAAPSAAACHRRQLQRPAPCSSAAPAAPAGQAACRLLEGARRAQPLAALQPPSTLPAAPPSGPARAAAGPQVFVGPFLKRQDRPGADRDAMYTNVYIKNLDSSTTDEEFVELVGKFGPYSSAVIQKVGPGHELPGRPSAAPRRRCCCRLKRGSGSARRWLNEAGPGLLTAGMQAARPVQLGRGGRAAVAGQH